MNSSEPIKNILVIAPTPFFADRGCHIRILEEVQAVMALGYQVTLCTYHIGRNINGIKIRRSINIPWYSKLSAGPSVHKFYLDLFLLFTVIRTCLCDKPKLIHAHLHEGVFIGKIASLIFKIPLVADIQGSLTGELLQHRFVKQGGLLHRFFRWTEDIIIRMPDFILSSFTTQLSSNPDVLRDIEAKTETIADGVDTSCFYPDYPVSGLREQLSIPDGVKVVGFLGVLTEYQGVSVLIEAISHLIRRREGVHFLIMGYPNVEHYREKAETLGISDYVTFTGRVAYEEAPRYLSMCDVLVSPKFHTTEANGKLLNYMAMGRPVVASDSSVNRAILGELGVYGEVGDALSFAEAIQKVLSDEKYASELGKRLRDKAVNEYSWQNIGMRISRIYEKLSIDHQTESVVSTKKPKKETIGNRSLTPIKRGKMGKGET